jgi:hypothetical protein
MASFRKGGQEGWFIQGATNVSGIDSYSFSYSDAVGPDDSCSGRYIQPGAWSLITAVVDREAGVYRCYLNGALWSSDAVTPISRPAITATAPLYIGARGFVPDKYFAGTIDDVRYYNRALSANEVKALYNAGR